jgi:multiple sugar transport system substrate-binding protein
MRRGAITLLLLALVMSTVGSAAAKPLAGQKTTKITIWVGWAGSTHELGVFKQVVAEYDRKHADVSVNVVGNINDNKITAAIRSGNVPDVVSSFNSYDVGTYCGTGAWIDLAPLMKQSHISASMFPAATQYYTQFKGKRCALPLLADTYGLYYNKTLLSKAGIKSPPKTMDELTADAKKLTQRDSKGNIKVAGFDPLIGFYENVPERMITSFGGKWQDSKGHAILASDPAWTKMAKWQKSLVDWYGYNKLVKFQAGLGDEFSASNAFEQGKLAMHLDGEWRVAFVVDDHSKIKYGTAPMPVDSARSDLYGSGYINGTIIGIPRGVKHQPQAWDLVKYLTTNSHALAILSNGLRNVPTTRASLKSPEIKPDPYFATFLKIFGNSHSSTSPITAAGVSYTDAVSHFFQQWQAGKVKDLAGGLKSLDKQLDAMVAQAAGP